MLDATPKYVATARWGSGRSSRDVEGHIELPLLAIHRGAPPFAGGDAIPLGSLERAEPGAFGGDGEEVGISGLDGRGCAPGTELQSAALADVDRATVSVDQRRAGPLAVRVEQLLHAA